MALLLLPDAVLAALFVALSIGLAMLGLALFHRIAPDTIATRYSAAASQTFNLVALLYAVIVGSLVASGWTRFSDAQANANAEAIALGNLMRYADGFEEPIRTQWLSKLLAYGRDVVDVEWPTMTQAQTISINSPAYEALWAHMRSITPQNDLERAYFAESIEQLTGLGEARRVRALNAQTTLSAPLWVLFLAGGAISIFFTYFFFDQKNVRTQAMLVALLAGLFGFVLFLLLSLQYPYVGDLNVRPDAFRDVIELWSVRITL